MSKQTYLVIVDVGGAVDPVLMDISDEELGDIEERFDIYAVIPLPITDLSKIAKMSVAELMEKSDAL